jgi:hypothetical protein
MSKTVSVSDYCPHLKKNHTVYVTYKETSSFDGVNSYVRCLADCEYQSQCEYKGKCPVLAKAPKNI